MGYMDDGSSRAVKRSRELFVNDVECVSDQVEAVITGVCETLQKKSKLW